MTIDTEVGASLFPFRQLRMPHRIVVFLHIKERYGYPSFVEKQDSLSFARFDG